MKALYRACVVAALGAGIAGCAVAPAPSTAPAAEGSTTTISTRVAAEAITIGKSTKNEVVAALGKTLVIRFDNGFEVWVYRVRDETPPATWRQRMGLADAEKASPAQTEFVVLFAPSGVVAKTRLRSAPPPAAANGRARDEQRG